MTPEELYQFVMDRTDLILDNHHLTQGMLKETSRMLFLVLCMQILKLFVHVAVYFKQMRVGRKVDRAMTRMNNLLLLVEQHGGITDRVKQRTEAAAEKVETATATAAEAAKVITERVGVVEEKVKLLTEGDGPITPHGPRPPQ